MNDDIRNFHIYGRLLAGKGVGDSYADTVMVDNLLYRDFGMSSEDILENFRSCSDALLYK